MTKSWETCCLSSWPTDDHTLALGWGGFEKVQLVFFFVSFCTLLDVTKKKKKKSGCVKGRFQIRRLFSP